MKRILTIDGGGIRGIFALQILRRIESLFREREGRDDLVLADAIDFFAGTSTGAIVATCLSWGMAVDEIEQMYIKNGSRMFTRSPWYLRIRSKYRAEQMASLFKETFCEKDGTPALLGTDRLKTALLIVMRNATTGSPWPISNNPDALYSDRLRDDCNLDLPLWQLLRASTAAPTFFTPERISVGKERFCFVDGGVSPYNNPSLLAFLMATLPCYRMGWETGHDKLHLISVGTGQTRSRLQGSRPERSGLFRLLGYVPQALIGSIAVEQDMLCRVLGDCLHGDEIDSEIGDLHGSTRPAAYRPQFSYVRYNKQLDVKDDETLIPPLAKAKLDDLKLIPHLQAAGKDYASKAVQPDHLDAAAL